MIPEGLHAKVKHERVVVVRPGVLTLTTDYNARQHGWEIQPRGGVTTCRLLDEEGNEVVSAEAVCNPAESFNKRLGHRIALGRAVHALRSADDASQVHP
jgi:hypothetical protein